MATRIFRVDLSDNARDYRPTATEPGLGMLDRQGANHAILRRWLGDFVADPEWQGDYVNFYVREEERGRLENIECYPATKHDLEGALKADLEALDARIKKAKPDSRTEQLLHKIAKQTFTNLTRDLDQSDHDSFFFQYREPGQPWKLLWCWGYQRADIQPGKALVCSNNNCQQLYVYRQDGDDQCPGCTTRGGRKKGGLPYGLTWTGIGATALALLLLLMLFMLLNPPTLIATAENWTGPPGTWKGPPGSRVTFKVKDQRYYFFTSDVTAQVLATSEDPNVIAFEGRGTKARAKSMGTAMVSFRLQDRVVTAQVGVTTPQPPDSIYIEPKELNLGVGSVGQVHVFGKYKDQSDMDITDNVEWEIADEKVVFGTGGLFEGASEGKTKVTARVMVDPLEGKSVDANLDVDVRKVAYKSLEVDLKPRELAIDQSGEVSVFALDGEGDKYRFHGSSQLQLRVEPTSTARLENDSVIGSATGKGELIGTLTKRHGSLVGKCEFQVGKESVIAAGTFEIVPGSKELTIRVGEYLKFQVISPSKEPIESASDNPEVVGINGPTSISGLKVGTANVTLKQAGQERKIAVTVVDARYIKLVLSPIVTTLKVAEVKPIKVLGITDDGKEVEVDPATVTWLRQPLADNVFFDRERMLVSGKSPTLEAQPIIATLDGLEARGAVEVIGAPGSAEIVIDEDFGTYPPIPTAGGFSFGPYLGEKDLVIRNNGVYVGDYDGSSIFDKVRIPRGVRIRSFGGRDLTGLDPGRVRDIFTRFPPKPGDVVEYVDDKGNVSKVRLGELVGIVEVKLVDVRPQNITAEDFNAEVLLDLKLGAEYRLTDSSDKPLSEWSMLSAGAGRIVSSKIARSTDADANYSLNVERKIGDKIEKFPQRFKIKSEDQP